MKNKPVLLGVTGASGSIYAKRFLEVLDGLDVPVELVLSEMGKKVCAFEKCAGLELLAKEVYRNDDFFAKPASGSTCYDSMVVLPCSMGSLGRIAGGLGDSLLTRAADVFLKERRKLILVPREMPFHAIHLENMQRLHRAGAVILSASPHFYTHPLNINDLVDTVVAKVLDVLQIEHSLVPKWGEE